MKIVKKAIFNDLNFKKNKVEIITFDSLTTDLCKKYKSNIILRGLRAVSDFEYEFQLAGMNRKLNSSIETIFLMSDLENQIISSRFVKEIAQHKGDLKKFTTKSTIKSLKQKYKIPNEKILGHSDIAPLRKIDPGTFFPWDKLNDYSIGLWANVTTNRSRLTKTEYKNFLVNLKKIGYQYLSSAKENKLVIDAFHRHHLKTLVGKSPNKSSLEKSKKLLRIKNIDLKG